jgi:hypothetical protein
LLVSHGAALGFSRVPLHQPGPAAIDIVAQRSAGLRTHGLEFVMQEFDQRSVRAFGREADVDFRLDRKSVV